MKFDNKYYKKWREENKEKRKKHLRNYYLKNKEKVTQRNLNWREKNPKRYKETREIWREKNKEKIKLYQKKYSKKWKEENPEYHKNYMKKYTKTEKGKINWKKYTLKRRALKKKAKDTLTKKELIIIQNRGKECVYCGSNKNLEFEHIISLNKGGENSFLNGVMACESCNSSKGNKDVYEWCKLKGYKVPKIIIDNLKLMKRE